MRVLPEGPWTTEPNHLVWVDEATGLDCQIKRGPMGALCGYVGVPKGHPAHGADYMDVDVSVHGGLTYGDECNDVVCHVPEPGRPDDVYWFGFDCGHFDDIIPAMETHVPRLSAMTHGTYKTIAYVRAEITHLAEQLAALA